MHHTRLSGLVLACCALLLGGCSPGDLTLPSPPDSNVVVTDFTPKQGYAGDLVSITGNGFAPSGNGMEILFAGGSARPESVASDGTSLTVRIPVGIDTGTLIVSAPGGRGTSKDSLTYLGPGHLQRPGAYTTQWVNYGTFSVCVTSYIAFLLSLEGLPETAVAGHRIVATLIGGAIGMAAFFMARAWRRTLELSGILS